jgi:O-antigen ligase
MNSLLDTRELGRPARDWVATVLGVLTVIAAGILIGIQYVTPDKRVLAVMMAVLVFGVAWRISMVAGIGLLVLALPYPRGTVFGNTNLALILLLMMIWLLRMMNDRTLLPRRTFADVPVLGLLTAYVVSFYNIDPAHLAQGFGNFFVFVACIGVFYLVVNNIHTSQHLARLHVFQTISIVMVCLLGVWELNNPGGVVIPGWIVFGASTAMALNLHDVRIGGPFFDFELLSEYCGLNALLMVFLLSQARSTTRRTIYAGVLVLVVFIMFATVTRGAAVALILAVLYLLWLVRKRLSFVSLVMVLSAAIVGIAAMNFYVANFTRSGDLLARITDPQSLRFVGVMPEARSGTWSEAFERMMLHPIIGHGPHYEISRGTSFWYWPHNLYLYIGNLVGFVGLGFFLWLMGSLWLRSRPIVDRLSHPNYAAAFLIVAHAQLVLFLIDQLKIEYLRNPIYSFQVWLMFATIVAAYRIARNEQAATATPPSR